MRGVLIGTEPSDLWLWWTSDVSVTLSQRCSAPEPTKIYFFVDARELLVHNQNL